jgi:spermidine synthase
VTETFGEPVTTDLDNVFRGTLLHRERSDYQLIEVYDHERFGRVLMLDEAVQTTESDEFCYHEMLVHPALCAREHIERALVIGGGDGGTLRHALMHATGEVVMCEIDRRVVEVSRDLMPRLSSGAFDDPRTTMVCDDGAAYVAGSEDAFDAIVVDSTDPVGPAVVLFGEEFYGACGRALKPGGVLVAQTGSPMHQEREFRLARGNMSAVFRTVETYQGFVPTYPGVVWSFTCATDADPVSSVDVRPRFEARGLATRFYTPELHAAAFVLPAFVEELVRAAAPAASVPRG